MSGVPKWLRVLGNTRAGVFVVDDRQRIALWNMAAQRILGYSEHEVLGQKCYRVVAGTNFDRAWCHANCLVQRQLSRGVLPEDFDLLTHTKEGKPIWINVSVICLSRKQRKLTLHLLREVTEQKAVEQALAGFLSTLERGPVAVHPETLPHRTVQQSRRRDLLASLTRREIEVLSFLADGLSSEAIAGRLSISVHTVRGHIENALRKLGLHSKAEAVAFAFRNRLL